MADDSPGKATQCSAVAPSSHCRLFTVNGITPSAGSWSLTDANSPVCDSVRGKSAFWEPSSFRCERVQRAAVVVEEVQLAVIVFAKRDESAPMGRAISGISFVWSPSNRAAHRRRVSQSPKT